jgi:stage II sporulation protein AA (anti-sigma F factor antagonist)
MVQQSPVDTVRELWARFERDGVEAALGLVDEDVIYLIQLAGGQVLRGSEEVRALLADVEAGGVSLEARLDALEARGDAVVASGTVRIERPDGLQEGRYHWVFHFADGRLRRLSVYSDREEALSSLAALNAIAPPPAEFEVEEGHDAGVITLRPAGELDIGTADRLQRALLEGRAPGDRVVLDLARLEFIDSTGLNVIVRAVEAARTQRWELRLRHGPPAVRRVFEIAGLISALPFDAP